MIRLPQGIATGAPLLAMTEPKADPTLPVAEPQGALESAIVKAVDMPPVVQQIMLGKVTIDTGPLPRGIEVIGVKSDELEAKCYITQTTVSFRRGKHALDIPKGYSFDGASVPRPFWGFRGFSPIGRHLWAACAHDYCCDFPDEIFPGIGDALFLALLTESGVTGWRAAIFYAAVRANHLRPTMSWLLGRLLRWSFRLAVAVALVLAIWKLVTLAMR